MSSSKLGNTRRESCPCFSASFWRRGMKRCSVRGSSELLSESLYKLSSHQIPHSLCSEGTTTEKGLYANSFFVLNHYAFGGVRAQALSVLVLSTSTTESSRRVPPPRGSRLAVPARDTPFVFLALARWSVRGVSIPGGFAAADPPLVRVRLPFVSAYVFTFAGVQTLWVRVPGRPEVFPGRDRHRVCPSQLICLPH